MESSDSIWFRISDVNDVTKGFYITRETGQVYSLGNIKLLKVLSDKALSNLALLFVLLRKDCHLKSSSSSDYGKRYEGFRGDNGESICFYVTGISYYNEKSLNTAAENLARILDYCITPSNTLQCATCGITGANALDKELCLLFCDKDCRSRFAIQAEPDVPLMMMHPVNGRGKET